MRKLLLIGLGAALALGLTGALFLSGVALAQSQRPAAAPTPVASAPYVNSNPADQARPQTDWGMRSGTGAWRGEPGMMNGCCRGGPWNQNGSGWGMHGWSMGMGWMHGYWGNTPAISATVPAPTSNPVSFQKDVQPIFRARCVACHGGTRGLFLNNYANVLQGSANGPVVVPGDPAGSRLVQYVASGFMPYGGPTLTPAQVQTLVNWVAAGAPNN